MTMTEALMIDNTARYSSTCMTPINDRDNTENVCIAVSNITRYAGE